MGKVNKNVKIQVKEKTSKVIAKAVSTGVNINAKVKSKLKPMKGLKVEDRTVLLHKTMTPKKITSKKDKFRQKHKNLMNKFALIKKQHKEEIARKKREKTAVIGDLKPLKDALPSLDELLKISKDAIRTGVKEFDEEPKKLSVKQKIKKKKNKFMSQVTAYQNLLKDPEFKKNPRDQLTPLKSDYVYRLLAQLTPLKSDYVYRLLAQQKCNLCPGNAGVTNFPCGQ